MDFAVAKITGKQYLVTPGQEIVVSGALGKKDESLVFSEVLLLSRDGKLSVGTPLVEGAKVTARVVGSGKGEKIRVAKFKAKSRYRRVMGFRPLLTTLLIADDQEKVVEKQDTAAAPQKRTSRKVGK